VNPNDLLFLTMPAAVAALKLGLIAFAVVMVARGIFQPRVAHAPRGPRDNRA